MLEESINSRFELVKFKLFEELQNGALTRFARPLATAFHGET